jgi:uncharacterized protein YjbJ (UPF0337 family)
MNWESIKGQWKQVQGKVRQQWGKLTDDDLNFIGGTKDQLVGKLQERYGLRRNRPSARSKTSRTGSSLRAGPPFPAGTAARPSC